VILMLYLFVAQPSVGPPAFAAQARAWAAKGSAPAMQENARTKGIFRSLIHSNMS